MKNKALLIVIVAALIVFVGSLTAGIIVAVNLVGDTNFENIDQFGSRLEEIIENNKLPRWIAGRFEDYIIDEQFEAPLDGIETIRIVGVSEPLLIESTQAGVVEGSLVGEYRSIAGEIQYIHEKQGATLLIKVDYPKFGSVHSDLKQTVRIPAAFDGNVSIVEVSADCTFQGADSLSWSSLAVKTVSGSIRLGQSVAGTINADTVSGSIRISQCRSDVSGKTVSGDIDITFETIMSANLNTVSGDITLLMPADSACEIRFKSVSGDFENPGLPIEISSEGSNRWTGLLNGGGAIIDADSVSGDLTVTTP